jgi:hypothetical protein
MSNHMFDSHTKINNFQTKFKFLIIIKIKTRIIKKKNENKKFYCNFHCYFIALVIC